MQIVGCQISNGQARICLTGKMCVCVGGRGGGEESCEGVPPPPSPPPPPPHTQTILCGGAAMPIFCLLGEWGTPSHTFCSVSLIILITGLGDNRVDGRDVHQTSPQLLSLGGAINSEVKRVS